jgi:hypothetical protein
MNIEIIDVNQGYKCYQASNVAVARVVRGFLFERNTTVAIGKEGIEFHNKWSTVRIVFKNTSLAYVARTEVRSEQGRAVMDVLLAAFPAGIVR